jgi:hypothetical protein
MRDRALQSIVFGGWLLGVPALASGMSLESAPLVAIGAWSLCAATAVALLDNVRVVVPRPRGRPYFKPPRTYSPATNASKVSPSVAH